MKIRVSEGLAGREKKHTARKGKKMFLRILRKDLIKRKATNLIVLLFVILAAMFVGGGLNNVLTVLNGTDYYLDKGGVGDYIIITMGRNALGSLDEMLKTEPSIIDYRLDNVVYASQDGIKKQDGSAVTTKNVPLLQSQMTSTFHFYNENNEEPAPLLPGHCYIAGDFIKKNDIKIGDTIFISQEDISVPLIVDGKIKDALLGSTFMGNTRFLLHEDDFQKFASDADIIEKYSGQICCIDTIDHDVKGVEDAVANCSNVAFNKPRSVIGTAYVMDMIVAFIVLILSVCLIILAFVVLKVSLSFTITKEFREIGVLKAIGIRNIKIRTLYLIKYLVIAIVGSVQLVGNPRHGAYHHRDAVVPGTFHHDVRTVKDAPRRPHTRSTEFQRQHNASLCGLKNGSPENSARRFRDYRRPFTRKIIAFIEKNSNEGTLSALGLQPGAPYPKRWTSSARSFMPVLS